MKCSVLDLVVFSVLLEPESYFSEAAARAALILLKHVRRLSSMNARIRVSNERLMYVYIRDLQIPMRTALGMNAQR